MCEVYLCVRSKHVCYWYKLLHAWGGQRKGSNIYHSLSYSFYFLLDGVALKRESFSIILCPVLFEAVSLVELGVHGSLLGWHPASCRVPPDPVALRARLEPCWTIYSFHLMC